MKRRAFARSGARGARKRDLIWCTTRIDQLILDDALLSSTTILSPAEWEASTTGFDRGTVLRIVGWLNAVQGAVGTFASQTMLAMYIIKNSSAATSAFSPLNAASYDSSDVLWSWGELVQSGTLQADKGRLTYTLPIDIKSKRKISSADVLQLVTAMDVDAAGAPTYALSGMLRVLVDRT